MWDNDADLPTLKPFAQGSKLDDTGAPAMSTVMIDQGGPESTPPRGARCLRCGERWPAVLATCPHDGTRLRLCPAEHEISLEVGARIGDYTVTGVLGTGGMSTVYSAVHALIGKRAAIKVIASGLSSRREAVLRFVQEARSVNQIGHPNIVDIFGFGTLPDGRCYQVLELLQGETLAERLLHGALSFREKVQVATEICDALEGVHARGFVHRDLKPENIFLVPVDERRLQVKLLDFGIAKLCPGDVPAPTLTAPEVTMGTPQYVSPEQARGKPVGPSSDVYALGVLCYELFAGQLPFAADSTIDFLLKHVNEAPIAPRQLWSGIPTSLETLLLRMLAKEPAERPHVVDVRATLASVLDEVAAPAAEAPPATTDRVARPPRLSIRATVGAVAAMLLLVGDPAEAPPSPATVVASTPAVVEPPPLPEVAAAAPVAAAVEAAPGPAPSPKAARKSRPRRATAPAKPTVDDDTLVDPFPHPSAAPR